MGSIDEVTKNIMKQIQEKADKTSGYVPLNTLCNKDFMKKNTKFTTIDELFEKGGFDIKTEEDLENVNIEKLNEHIKATTNFDSWEDMRGTAGTMYVTKMWNS